MRFNARKKIAFGRVSMHRRYPTKMEVIVLGKKLCKTPKHATVYPKEMRDGEYSCLGWVAGNMKNREMRGHAKVMYKDFVKAGSKYTS